MVLDASLLNTQHYKVRIKGKVEPSREGVAPSPTSWYSSYRKGSLRITLDYGRQLFTYIYIYVCVCVYVCARVCVCIYIYIYIYTCVYPQVQDVKQAKYWWCLTGLNSEVSFFLTVCYTGQSTQQFNHECKENISAMWKWKHPYPGLKLGFQYPFPSLETLTTWVLFRYINYIYIYICIYIYYESKTFGYPQNLLFLSPKFLL